MTRWYDDADCPDLSQPVPDVLANLQARTDAILAELHAANARDDRGELVEIDPQACDDWIASRDAEFDVTSEVA